MTQTKLFDDYVRRRLDAWGREFALHRDGEVLGHASKNMLQILVEHRGEMPGRVTGYRPLTIPPMEMQIEDIVSGVYRTDPHLAWTLRAYYCGAGRQRVERFETARSFIGGHLKVRMYYAYHVQGFDKVRDHLLRAR